MATETLYPNSAGGAAWWGEHSAYPGTALADFADNAYTSTQENTTSTDDNNYVAAVQDMQPYVGHRVRYTITADRTKVTQLDFTSKVESDDPQVQLCVWNFTTSAWVVLDSDDGPGKLTLTGAVSASLTDYINGSGQIEILLDEASGWDLYHYFSKVVLTYTTGGPVDLAGSAALVVGTAAAPLSVTRNVAGSAALLFGASGLVGFDFDLAGSASLLFETSEPELGFACDLAGSAALLFGTAAALGRIRNVSGSAALTFAVAGTLNPNVDLAGSAAMIFGHWAHLEAEVTVPIAGVAAMTFGTAAVMKPYKGLAGSAALAFGMTATRIGWPVLPIEISVPAGQVRELRWDTGGQEPGTEYWLLIDGEIAYRTSEDSLVLPETQEVRQFLLLYPDPGVSEEEAAPWFPTPYDRVRLAWSESEGAAGYRVYRKLGAGAYALLASLLSLSFDDDPLPDAVYSYKVVAYDDEGDTADSNEAAVTVSSAPEPPTGLTYSWNAETKTLTLSWGGSPSADVATYRVRSSAGQGWLDPESAPVQDSADLTYEQVFTDESGTYIFSVRAVDSDGIQEANIGQMLALAFEEGALAMLPAEPNMVYAEATPDGKIEVGWLYRPWKEVNGPGAAYEARIYWDAGTGTVDFDEPHATVAMGGPTAETSYEWESAVLTNDLEYRFVVRIATAAWPAGIETENTDEVYATADSDVPAAPTLQAQLI